jgi:hypothetical protein
MPIVIAPSWTVPCILMMGTMPAGIAISCELA